MDNIRLLFLLNKQAQAACTSEEQAELDSWYQNLGESAPQAEQLSEPAFALEMLQQFRKRVATPPVVVKKIPVARMRYWVAAASVLLVLLAGSIFFLNYHNKPTPASPEIVFVKPAAPAAFIRQLTLPDGSRVVLQPNSTLQFKSGFTGNTRSVFLTGEAYFDVMHNPARPFVIHTGTVNTTVLGTAFNIRAWPGQPTVAVTVTRGKVRVSNGQQTLALLTANQQLLYNPATAAAQQKQQVEPVTGWLKNGMSFTDQSMGTIVPALENRFQKTIGFANPTLQNCMVTASFDGTETLEQVLDILCLTTNGKYRQEGSGYLLSGEGCP